MKLLLIALLLMPLSALAASPEENYLAARDKFIEQLAPKDGAEVEDKADARARATLEKQMRAIIGPLAIAGLPAQGKSNLDTLISSGEMGYGHLDGLVYEMKGGKPAQRTRLLVSTPALLNAWLIGHKDWWEKQTNAPTEINAALQSEPFYTQALSTDAAVFRFAGLPVTASGNARFATAMLVHRQQDIGLTVPDELMVAMVGESRVYIWTAPAAVKIAMIPACEAVWKSGERTAEALYEKYKASDLKDEAVFDQYTKAQEIGDVDFRKCFAERAPAQPWFAALAKQAQGLVDRIK